jgi:hypothetical protein
MSRLLLGRFSWGRSSTTLEWRLCKEQNFCVGSRFLTHLARAFRSTTFPSDTEETAAAAAEEEEEEEEEWRAEGNV